MMDNFEQQKLSGVLDRTPRSEPSYSEVKGALDDLRHGDVSDNPLFSIIHGHVGALYKSNKLDGSRWKPLLVPGGVFIPHQDFLNIQNDFASLEGNDNGVIWNSETCLDTMGKYIGRMQQYRQRHNTFYKESQKYLTEDQARKVDEIKQRHSDLLNENDGFVLVAMPSHIDNPKLWEDFNIAGTMLDRIPAWAKISERGVILGSRLLRHDDPRGHDYFSYAARAVRSGETKNMTDKLMLTAQHEGSHGITDTTLIDLLKLGSDNPIYEGLVGALGEDERERKKSPSFSDLLSNPQPTDISTRRDTTYYSGARYWKSLYRILAKTNDNPWPAIMGSSLGVAADLSNKHDLMSKDSSMRISSLLHEVPVRLGIEIKDLEKEYADVSEGN